MSRKKHPEHVNHERWLVSYADFITLLFAFFVVLFASGQSDKKKQTQLAAAMQSAFTPLAAFDAHSRTPPIDPTPAAGTLGTPAPLQPPLPSLDQATQAAAIEAHINKLLSENPSTPKLPPNSVTMHSTPEGLVISLHEAGFFPSGASELRPASINLLTRLAATLPLTPLRIEGHTDNVPIHTAQFASNWELSTARAAAIARLILEHSAIPPANLAAAGYAEFHPAASNETESGRTKNRRVDIILLSRPAPPPSPSPTQSHPAPSR